jgi:radical SAM superfamily enzyme with C-terminal helix-hairpin-helix motif
MGKTREGKRSLSSINRWNKAGAHMIRDHPWYPNVICEIETSRGCPRENHCSFCSEGLLSTVEFRSNEDILDEINSLINAGATRIRLGRQADILQHGSALNNFKDGFPEPNTSYAIELFNELKALRIDGKLEIVNIDNANPGTIKAYPEESKKIIRAIAQAVSPGDTMALGVETFDEAVVSANNLKIAPDDVLKVIEIINEAGCERVNGIPRLLPGINIIHGLRGENKKTFEKNYEGLLNIVKQDLLIKRIYIRQLTPYPGTVMEHAEKSEGTLRKKFEYFRDKRSIFP